MTGQMNLIVVFDDRIDRGLVERLLTSGNRLTVSDYLDMSVDRLEEGHRADVVVVAVDEYTADIGAQLAETRSAKPGCPVVLVCAAAENGYVGEAIDAGADDIFVLPSVGDPRPLADVAHEFEFTIEKVLARRRGAKALADAAVGRMVCVLGLKGGSGKTLVAANLAVCLAEAGHSVALVDLDLQFGDIGLALGTSPERTLYDLVASGGSLDAEKLSDFMMVHESGVRALLAPARPDQAGVITPEFLRGVYALLREVHDFVVVDTPPGFTPEVIGAVDTSTDACMVAMLDSLSLKNTKLGLETLELMGYSGTVRLVLNRADSNVGISPEDVVTIMGRRPDVLIPSERDIVRSVNEGRPVSSLHPRSDAARAFRALAGLYDGTASNNGHGHVTAGRRRLLLRSRQG
jgi:pilus assembly protein CpaE